MAVGWGTSFSAPFVSGTVALIGSLAPPGKAGLLNQATAAFALSHAQPIPEVQYGFGVLDSYQAVQAWQSFLNANVNVNAACSGASCQATISGTLF
jgi:subtilisin family serine protease